MAEYVITNVAKKKILEARAGIRPFSKIKGVAFGDGAIDGSLIRAPSSRDTTLVHELLRKDVDGHEVISNLKIRYICTLTEPELAGKTLNELALFDEDGDLIAIKSFSGKGKDGDMQMIFELDDSFEEG
jgi:phage-related tail fiber protein